MGANLTYVFTFSRRLIKAERASGVYRLSSAYLAKLLCLIPWRLLCTAVFTTIIYYLAGFRTDSFTYFLIYFGLCQLITLAMMGVGLML